MRFVETQIACDNRAHLAGILGSPGKFFRGFASSIICTSINKNIDHNQEMNRENEK